MDKKKQLMKDYKDAKKNGNTKSRIDSNLNALNSDLLLDFQAGLDAGKNKSTVRQMSANARAQNKAQLEKWKQEKEK